MTHADTIKLQRLLNAFTKRYLKYVTPVRIDGEYGFATKKRVRAVKYYLGYKAERRNNKVDQEFINRIRQPKNAKYSSALAVLHGMRRRIRQRHEAEKNHKKAHKTSGVGVFDGHPVANWMIPYLEWAREHGWAGTVNSGWRDPVYSRSLCIRMCGRPSCPGRCAGLSSNHVGSVKPRGALDVTHYQHFGMLMARCPFSPRLFNALGAQDPVHFSASGR